MSSTRKNEISLQLFRTLQILKEADASGGAVPQQPQQPPQAVANSNPMQPLPGQAQQQVVGSSSGEPMSATGEPLSVDSMIDKINVIRGGRSFSEPEVYGQLTTIYKSLSDQDKVTIDRVLGEIGKIVIQQGNQTAAPAGQMQGTTPAQPPPGGAMGRGAMQQPGAAQAMTGAAPGGMAGPTGATA